MARVSGIRTDANSDSGVDRTSLLSMKKCTCAWCYCIIIIGALSVNTYCHIVTHHYIAICVSSRKFSSVCVIMQCPPRRGRGQLHQHVHMEHIFNSNFRASHWKQPELFPCSTFQWGVPRPLLLPYLQACMIVTHQRSHCTSMVTHSFLYTSRRLPLCAAVKDEEIRDDQRFFHKPSNAKGIEDAIPREVIQCTYFSSAHKSGIIVIQECGG